MKAATAGKGAFETLAVKDGTQLDLNYRDSSLTLKGEGIDSTVQPGDRGPDVQLADGSWLSQQLSGTGWKLVQLGHAQREVPTQLTVINTDDQALRQAYGLSEGLVLIRPDGYIALITADVRVVYQYFDRFE